MFSFLRVDTRHFFITNLFSKVDISHIFQHFSFSEVDTLPENTVFSRLFALSAFRFWTNLGSVVRTRPENVSFFWISPRMKRR